MTLRQVGAASQEERIGDLQIFIRLVLTCCQLFQATLNTDWHEERKRWAWTQVTAHHGVS